MKKAESLLRLLLNPRSGVSSRRFIALIMTIHFVVTSYYILFFKSEIRNSQALLTILEYEFWIILGGFGFITLADFGLAFIRRAEARMTEAVQGIPETPGTDVKVENMENPTINTESVTLENNEGNEKDA